MPRKEKKLLKWIIKRLNENKFEWHDKTNCLFWMPWPRQKCKKWDETESEFIIDYIKMQGSYRPGDQKLYVNWKARLRTALNKESALKEIKEKMNKTAYQPKKLYKILQIPKGCKVIKDEVPENSMDSYKIYTGDLSPETDNCSTDIENVEDFKDEVPENAMDSYITYTTVDMSPETDNCSTDFENVEGLGEDSSVFDSLYGDEAIASAADDHFTFESQDFGFWLNNETEPAMSC